MSYESFLADGKTQDAVIRNISDVEWSKIIRSRHIITHEYDDIDYSVIWKIVTVYVPSLKLLLEKILKEL